MNSWIAPRLFGLLAIAGLTFGLVGPPAPAGAESMPSYARAAHQETIEGTIASFNGQYTMYVNDRHGYVDDVRLHQGTVINPTGIRLEPGMSVTVYGFVQGRTFAANRIDTPYQVREYYYPRSYYGWYGGYWPGWYAPRVFIRVGGHHHR